MANYLMWEYQGVDVGRFHSATTTAKRASMISKGYADITDLQGWAVPYPTGKNVKVVKPAKPDTQPSIVVPSLPDTQPAPVDPIV